MTDTGATTRQERFDASRYSTFRFLSRSLSGSGEVSLCYALDDELKFEERFLLPVPESGVDPAEHEALLAMLHSVAGVSYFKLAAPGSVALQDDGPPPAAARLLEGAVLGGLGRVRGRERARAPPAAVVREISAPAPRAVAPALRRVLVPVGGGKDSAVAIEIVRRSGLDLSLFSVGTATPIDATVEAAGLPRLLVHRQIDGQIGELNRRGALNGHVPITAIVSCVALLTASLNGFDAIAFANERSASAGNTVFDGVEVNPQ